MNTFGILDKQTNGRHMTSRKYCFPAALCFFLLLLCPQFGRADAPSPAAQLTAAGSGVNLAITRQLAEAFMAGNPRIAIDVPGSIGSKGAIEAVSQGAIAFGLISRPLNEKEKELGLTVRPYARTAIVIAVHAGVPDNEITTRDLIEIFKGEKTQWGNGSQIFVQARDKADSGFLVLQDHLPGFREAYQASNEAHRWTLYFNDQDANEAIAKVPSAIGVTDLGMISTEKLPVKILKLDGVTPDLENLASGTYPLARTLVFIYRNDQLTPDMKAFLSFVFSPEGEKILKSNNYLPVR
jgi:phosphate transport system substrate-binding protein